MSERHLYISDMDGTLLGTDSLVSPRSASILSELSRRGVLFTVATARTPATVEPLLADVESTVPAIVMTGAALWDRVTQSYIEPHFIDDREIERILHACQRHGITPLIYTLTADDKTIDVYCPGALDAGQQQFVDERSSFRLKRFHLNTPLPTESRARVVLIYILGAMAEVEKLAAEIDQDCNCSISVYADIFDSTRGNLEIFAPGVSKAAGIKRLIEITGATGTTVFGDNMNDLSMMAVSDRAIAVDNAVDAVKQAADMVIGPNTADSVASFIASEN